MLVFFIHGVATSDASYSDELKKLIRNEFCQKEQALPHFYSSFWGAVHNQTGTIWNGIHNDLTHLRKKHPNVDSKDIFRYQEFREDFISKFFGDFLTYFNDQRGRRIRAIVVDQLEDLIQNNPQETELHIVAHSLGTIILWDLLFASRFAPDDPATKFRQYLEDQNCSATLSKLKLQSVTTLGSPLLFFSMI